MPTQKPGVKLILRLRPHAFSPSWGLPLLGTNKGLHESGRMPLTFRVWLLNQDQGLHLSASLLSLLNLTLSMPKRNRFLWFTLIILSSPKRQSSMKGFLHAYQEVGDISNIHWSEKKSKWRPHWFQRNGERPSKWPKKKLRGTWKERSKICHTYLRKRIRINCRLMWRECAKNCRALKLNMTRKARLLSIHWFQK